MICFALNDVVPDHNDVLDRVIGLSLVLHKATVVVDALSLCVVGKHLTVNDLKARPVSPLVVGPILGAAVIGRRRSGLRRVLGRGRSGLRRVLGRGRSGLHRLVGARLLPDQIRNTGKLREHVRQLLGNGAGCKRECHKRCKQHRNHGSQYVFHDFLHHRFIWKHKEYYTPKRRICQVACDHGAPPHKTPRKRNTNGKRFL